MSTPSCCQQHISARGFLRQRMARDTSNRTSPRNVGWGQKSHSSWRRSGSAKAARTWRKTRAAASPGDTPSTWHISPEAKERGFVVDTLVVLETNVDDLSPQIMAYAFEELLAAGALDVWATPVQMKKGRIGTLLSTLCEPGLVEELVGVLFKETSSLGIRINQCDRVSLPRTMTPVNTKWGDSVNVKVASLDGKIKNVHPEYDDCVEVARANDIPLKNVFQNAVEQYFEMNPSEE